MGSKHSTQHVRSLDGKNSFVESLAIRKDAFSQESTSQNSCGVPVRKKSIFLLDGISKLTYCYVNGLPNKGGTTKSGEGIGLLKPAFSLYPKA